MHVTISVIVISFAAVSSVLCNSAPEQAIQAREYLAAQAKKASNRPTRTVADQPTITLHEVRSWLLDQYANSYRA